ncbi:hypothetical protein H0H93_007998 [Arthromyces matolae]|nr:hypothetical protein H0H93_007998 [Arthromyces matolae]
MDVAFEPESSSFSALINSVWENRSMEWTATDQDALFEDFVGQDTALFGFDADIIPVDDFIWPPTPCTTPALPMAIEIDVVDADDSGRPQSKYQSAIGATIIEMEHEPVLFDFNPLIIPNPVPGLHPGGSTMIYRDMLWIPACAPAQTHSPEKLKVIELELLEPKFKQPYVIFFWNAGDDKKKSRLPINRAVGRGCGQATTTTVWRGDLVVGKCESREDPFATMGNITPQVDYAPIFNWFSSI